MTTLFDRITQLSIRFRWITIALTVAFLAAGILSLRGLNLELLPRIEFPQTIVIVQWPDAESGEQFLQEVTIPLEESFSAIEGVVNVESTTNPGFSFIVVRYDFGLNSERMLENIENALDEAGLPETADPQLLNFSLSDLPVVVASVSSSELTLAELKDVVELELQPQLAALEQVSEVAIGGGQELPDETIVEEPEVVEEVVAEEPVDPGRLPFIVIEGARQLGIEVEYAQDVTPELLEGLNGTEEQVMAVLRLIPVNVLPYAPPETLSLLPSELIATFDADLVAQLNELAADYGGVGQYTLAEVTALINGEPLEPEVVAEEPIEEETVAAEPTEEAVEPEPEPAVELPTPDPIALPESWIVGAAALGQTISTTADITPELMQGIISFAPEQMAELTAEMWRAFDPAVTAVALPTTAESLDPQLLAQLIAIQQAANGLPPQPAPLPESWIAVAAASGFALTTTADIPASAFGLLVGAAPQLLTDLTEETLLALPAEALAALPPDYVAGLDEGLQQTLTNVAIANARYLAQSSAGEEIAAEEPGRLPDLLIAGLAQAGVEIEYAQDIDADLMRLLGSFGPQASQFLSLLTPDHLRLMQPEVIALLPADFVEGLEADLRAELDELAAEFGGAGQLAVAEAEAADPARLPDVLIQGAAQTGVEIEFAQDLTPDLVRLFGGLGEQATAILGLLTPAHLRLLPAESIALLPMSYLETLDGDLRAELDELAAEFGGAGQLAIEEAEAAAALSEGAPELTGVWTEPGPNGEEPLFKTAADFLSSPFAPTAAELLNFIPLQSEDPPALMGDLTPDVIAWLAENEEGFVANLELPTLELMSPETLAFMLETYPDAFAAETAERLQGIVAGTVEVFIPEASVTRTDGNPSVIISIFKDGDANTVEVAHRVFDTLAAYTTAHPEIVSSLVFEQATFIEDSIEGVSREGALGAVFAVLVILLFLSGHVGGRYKLSWRATIVTAISIPLSIFTAFFLMRWMPPTLGTWLQGAVDSTNSDILLFISRLFPTNVTLNIMTLSGLTVAIGRVVDDSIVVLENSYRFIQRGDDPKTAVINGTKEVAVAIFSATVTTMAVFLPLGLIGGLIGTFFLPFGLTVTYALAASFIVSITVVPALTYMLIRKEHIPEERETTMQRWYTPALEWSLNHRGATLGIAAVIFLGSLFLLAQLPQSFIPSLGEPTINVTANLPSGTQIVTTNELVENFESDLSTLDGIEKIQTEVGSGGGFEAIFVGSGVAQNAANITISVEDQDELATLTNEIRAMAQAAFGEDAVQVSAASQAGFGGFALILTGESLDELRELVPEVKAALEAVDLEGDGIADIANVSSNVDNEQIGGGDTIIRIDGRSAISFSGELETQNTLGVTEAAKEAIAELNLPAGVTVTEGFDSQQQTEGFQSMISAIGYSIVIVYLIMALTFRSLIHPFTILFSLPFALVGAAIALYITDSVLGISAMIGLMMLVGIVVTNGIVLMELVQQLRAKGENAYDALVEGGRTRLRPILMTALTAILALIPLAASQEAGAIIASELARAVMGGLIVSTALTLVVIPVVYSLFDQLGSRLRRK